MAARIERFFTKSDREAIRAATTAAERETSGELVVYVVERCDPHPEAAWKGAAIGGAIGVAFAAIVARFYGGWGASDDLWLLIGLQLGLLAGWSASRVESVARLLIGDVALMSRVEGRAAEAFVDEQVFATRNRTGVLIFIALFEHRVLVLADEGIRQRVGDEAFDDVAAGLAEGIRAGRPAAALLHAVEQCAGILEGHRAPGDVVDELHNEPRFRDA